MNLDSLVEVSHRRQRLPRPELRKLIRENAKVTQEEAAAVLGVRRATIARYENGTRTPRSDLCDRYMSLLSRLSEVA